MPEFTELNNFLEKYFGDLIDPQKIEQFRLAFAAYVHWNAKINVISRKDIENLAERHFLHSLAIAKVIRFKAGTQILDIGTGGGFPGIPLSIVFPEAEFQLIDSIGKKIKVVEEVVTISALKNVHFNVQRAEQLDSKHDFVISRAVTNLVDFKSIAKGRIRCPGQNELTNGILYLKGEDDELKKMLKSDFEGQIWPLADIFEEAFFSSKYLVHLPICK